MEFCVNIAECGNFGNFLCKFREKKIVKLWVKNLGKGKFCPIKLKGLATSMKVVLDAAEGMSPKNSLNFKYSLNVAYFYVVRLLSTK